MTIELLKTQVQTRLTALPSSAPLIDVMHHLTMASGMHSALTYDAINDAFQALSVDTATLNALTDKEMGMLNLIREGLRRDGIRFADHNMPVVMGDSTDFSASTADGSKRDSNISTFWVQTFDVVDTNKDTPFEGFSTIMPNDSNVNTVMSVAGESGIFTHLLTASITAASDVIIYIEVDGIETVYNLGDVAGGYSNQRIGFGGFMQGIDTTNVGDSSVGDHGFEAEHAYMIPPSRAIERGIGIPFSESLKVSYSSSAGNSTSTTNSLAGVIYARR